MFKRLKNRFIVTSREPIFGTLNESHCYLKTSEFTNRPEINQFCLGTVVHDDEFDRLYIQGNQRVKVKDFIL